MSFSTLFFLFVFLPVSLILYYVVPVRFRSVPLVLVSLLFFSWSKPAYLVFLLLNLAINYAAGLEIDALKQAGYHKGAKAAMIITVVVNVLTLFFFKYLAFFLSNLNLIPGLSISVPSVEAPVAILFYIPTVLSYIVDVYMDRAPVQKNVLNYLVYATFFPKFLSGPIVQYRDMAQQLSEPHPFKKKNLYSGAKLFCIGLFKKVLLADTMGNIFNAIFALESMSIGTAWLGAVLYSFQLYFDFSGYSDMAIGISGMLGYEIAPNFNYPYRSVNITDLWRRWHISLGAWYREYIYFPLGGSRCSTGRTIFNLLVVWFLTGLWHGASWTFILWGLWHGLFSILERFVIRDRLDGVPHGLRVFGTCVITFIGWVMFFSGTMQQMLFYFGQMFGAGHQGLFDSSFLYYFRSSFLLLLASVVGSGPLVKNLHNSLIYRRGGKLVWVSAAVFAVLLVLSIATMVSATYTSFLYFQF